jgi:ABC-type polysaccharide/polyol phosphate transport system ATPase subunit
MGDPSPAVRLVDAGKRYLKYEDRPLLLGRALRFRAANRRTPIWAVRHVDLEVPEGATYGVIGRNGSGKSTMLRMLAGVTAPTEGVVSVRGRVAPLIAVGVGFHPELTGRENVYVNGMILGLSRAEIDRLFERIVDFAELADFIDTPVKFYSSGMLVRLGFSVAVASHPNVLLVDEVLAVGDLAFQHKCFERMGEIQEQGTSVLIVSHNLTAVRRLCSKVLVLHDGLPRFFGEVEDAISVYHDLLDQATLAGDEAGPGPAGPVEAFEAQLLSGHGASAAHVTAGEPVVLRVRARFRRDVPRATFGLLLYTADGELVYREIYNDQARAYRAGETVTFEVRFPAALATGSYTARGVLTWGLGTTERVGTNRAAFFVDGRRGVRGVVDLRATVAEVDETGLGATEVAGG